MLCETWQIKVKLGFAKEFAQQGDKSVEQWVTCLDMESNLIGYTPNGLAELTNRCPESCRLCKPNGKQQKRTTTATTTTTTTAITRSVASTTGAETTAVQRPSWSDKEVQQRTKKGNAAHCYIALFVGERCETPGAVYRVTPAWYHSHKGGKDAIVRSCGKVVENWGSKGGHAQYITQLQFSLNITGKADYVADILCSHEHAPVIYELEDTTTTTTTTTAKPDAVTKAATTPAPATPPPVDKSCADTSPQCSDWALQGLCSDPSLAANMAWQCATSCGVGGCGTPRATAAGAAAGAAAAATAAATTPPPLSAVAATKYLQVTATLVPAACAAQSDEDKTRNLATLAGKTGQRQSFDLDNSIAKCRGNDLVIQFALKPTVADQDSAAQLVDLARKQLAGGSPAVELISGGQIIAVRNADLAAQLAVAGNTGGTTVSSEGGSSSGGSDNTGAVVGAVFAVLLVLVLCAVAAAWWHKKRQDEAVRSSLRHQSRTSNRTGRSRGGGRVAQNGVSNVQYEQGPSRSKYGGAVAATADDWLDHCEQTHGTPDALTRDSAKALLMEAGAELGSYCIRPSSKGKSMVVLCVLTTASNVANIRMEIKRNGSVAVLDLAAKPLPFGSVDEALAHFADPNAEPNNSVPLGQPIGLPGASA